jgi:hypothetical protein
MLKYVQNSNYALKLCTAPSGRIFAKPTTTQKCFTDIHNTECFPDRIGNVENASKRLIMPLEYEWH